ncbi:lytic transglycosylase domain-containing protein [Klebsiella pneumoniae]|jgi:soluble lytic murein transglycosylase-like protein|uniref:lytic transglycosylase domain-containing protein n=1 Tax=Klebsiella pneumoniae TaxID=573 RepID=UPI0011DD62C5|nr:lytic transglycosylase domain-containing protein [Klebsiella pneumoniae]MCJ9549972.1 lytic transglycosylase domain-containing protein [Klebsiella quasipneumoniae]HAM6914732.1 lytic transglycosylase domain-containing protein [Escherichia coli]ELI6778958.1 lytic transglycosylase domain-containing protein [Klebsiella pneumoniae]MBC4042252.1 lytic transglycosylase domain-containing protein [Klebsiella pneumoniae]MCJ6364892.1 lytic transglycosylase domain-containing protein [Klebsiella pneumonia
MAATVIDALLVTLGLDTSQFRKGQQEVSDDLKKQREDAKNTAKEMAEQGKKAASFFSSIKTELLALTGVTVTAGGLISFVKSTTSGLMDLSIQSKALGLSARELDGWSKSAEAAGSSAEKISASLQGFQGAIQGARVGDYSSSIFGGLAQLNALTGQNFDVWGQDASSLAKTSLDALRKISDPNLRRQVGLSLGFDDATLQRNQEGKFLPDVDRLTKSSGITDASTKGAKEFTAAWAELGQNLDTVKNQIYVGLIPTIRDLNGLLIEWSSGNAKSSSFFKELKRDINDITGIDLGSWTLSGDLRNLKDNFSMLGKVLNHLGNALNELNNGNFSKAADEFKKAWYGTEDGKPTGNDALPGVTKAAEQALKKNGGTLDFKPDQDSAYLSPQQQATQKMLDAVKFQPLPEQRRQQQDERDYWESTKNLLSKIADALISPAGAATMQPDTSGYQPNVPLNAQAARLGAKGRAFLQAMAGEFGALEGKYGLPAGLLSSVAGTESGGDPFAVSPKGAKGPFQFMDGTARDLGLKGMDVYDPHKSADAAARYLRYLLDATGGDLEKALASYNWGLGNVQKKGMDNLPSETRNYVPKVMAGMRPGAGMAVDRAMPGQSGATYQFYGTKITTQAQNVEQLTSDIKKHGDNRVMLLAGYSGQ